MKIIFKIRMNEEMVKGVPKEEKSIVVFSDEKEITAIKVTDESAKSFEKINDVILNNLPNITLEKDKTFKEYSQTESTFYKIADKIYNTYFEELNKIKENLVI